MRARERDRWRRPRPRRCSWSIGSWRWRRGSFSFWRRRPDPSACATARSDASATPACRTSAATRCRSRCSPTPLCRLARTCRCGRSRLPSPPGLLSAKQFDDILINNNSNMIIVRGGGLNTLNFSRAIHTLYLNASNQERIQTFLLGEGAFIFHRDFIILTTLSDSKNHWWCVVPEFDGFKYLGCVLQTSGGSETDD